MEIESTRERAAKWSSDHAKARVEVHRMWTNVAVLALIVASVFGAVLLAGR